MCMHFAHDWLISLGNHVSTECKPIMLVRRFAPHRVIRMARTGIVHVKVDHFVHGKDCMPCYPLPIAFLLTTCRVQEMLSGGISRPRVYPPRARTRGVRYWRDDDARRENSVLS